MSERLEKPTAWTQTRNRRRTIALRGATSRDDRLRRVRPAWLARGHRPDGIDVQGHDATDQGSGDALGYRPRRGDDVVRVPVSEQFVGSVLDKGSPCEELGLNRKIGHTRADQFNFFPWASSSPAKWWTTPVTSPLSFWMNVNRRPKILSKKSVPD